MFFCLIPVVFGFRNKAGTAPRLEQFPGREHPPGERSKGTVDRASEDQKKIKLYSYSGNISLITLGSGSYI